MIICYKKGYLSRTIRIKVFAVQHEACVSDTYL